MPRREMGPDDLYRYVAAIAKRKQLKFEELARRMQMSKTTLWRYMKGMNAFTPEMETRMSDALAISDDEREELRRLISINLVDSSLVAARYVLDKFMFADTIAPLRPTQIDFTYYDKAEKDVKSSDVIRDIMYYTEKPDCSCDAWVLNCVEGAALENVTYLLGSLIPSSASGCMEQLVVMPEKNYRRNILQLLSLLPLLRVKGYKLRFTRNVVYDLPAMVAKNSVLIRISYTDGGESKQIFFALEFNMSATSHCVKIDDENYFNFLKSCYDNYSRSYSGEIPTLVDISPFEKTFCDFEIANDYAMIKYDLSYGVIEPEIYQSLVSRMTEYDVDAFGKAFNSDASKALENSVEMLKKRYMGTRTHRACFIHSRSGLENFARTGKFRDFSAPLPAFNKRELRRIFENLKNRMLDEQDKLEMYITYKDFLFSGQSLCASPSGGTYIDIGVTKRLKGMNESIFIEDTQIAQTVFDYATNHVPAYHALSKPEAAKFIDSLIEKYMM